LSNDELENLDSDTKRFLYLHIGDLIFREANRWVKRLDDKDFETLPKSKEEVGVAEALFTAKTKYREQRMRYTGVMRDFKVRRRDYEEYLRRYSDQDQSNPVPVDGEHITELFDKMERDTPMYNYKLRLEELIETRQRQVLAARNFLALLDKANGMGFLKSGEGLRRKLTECSQKQVDLENDLE
jgi:hypothetical protein